MAPAESVLCPRHHQKGDGGATVGDWETNKGDYLPLAELVPDELANEAANLLADTVEAATGHKPALRINRPAPELAGAGIPV
jgi:hypothetical protein